MKTNQKQQKPYVSIDSAGVTLKVVGADLRWTSGQFEVLLQKLPAYAVQAIVSALTRLEHDQAARDGGCGPPSDSEVLSSLYERGVRQGKARKRHEEQMERQAKKREKEELRKARILKERYG